MAAVMGERREPGGQDMISRTSLDRSDSRMVADCTEGTRSVDRTGSLPGEGWKGGEAEFHSALLGT